MQCLLFVTFLATIWTLNFQFVVTIEVHEVPNENTTQQTLKSTLPNASILSENDFRSTSNASAALDNKPPPVTTGTTDSVDYGSGGNSHQTRSANNGQHSSSYRDTPLSVITPSSTSSPSASASAGFSSGSSFKKHAGLKDFAGSNMIQQQISGYKKRQLYGSSIQQSSKNGTSGRSFDKQSARQASSKEFIPSPELVHYYTTENRHNPPPGINIHQVDAAYPTNVANSDSRWYGGSHLNYPVGFDGDVKIEQPSHNRPSKAEHYKGGKFLWVPNVGDGVESPFSHLMPKFTPPKGMWKWVPEEEEGDSAAHREPPLDDGKESDLESKIIAGNHYYKIPIRDQPYTFDVISEQTPFSGGGGYSDEPESTTKPLGYVLGGDHGSRLQIGGKGHESLKNVSPWKKIIHVLTAAIPIGLIISALTPQVVYVNPNMTQSPVQMQTPSPISATGGSFTNPTRQRSEDNSKPSKGDYNSLLKFINAISVSALTRAASGCEEKSFCEMARLGINHEADMLFKMLWKIANETPTERARQSGLDEIFRAVKDDDCSRFRCEST
ncbi:uncharacterized protein LOC129774586 [Toxorhynchites rutilus septentrionalis]|uniref:uncharacterized protein LOC129774586 n=1 Tax=Toxorhynchites rutilus septentrionalis TaxID=329112 RepID=UPI00247A1E10|nr:uncharacterized protein LOC129774586 [Toxorhynchites rutilus septentrionalis]